MINWFTVLDFVVFVAQGALFGLFAGAGLSAFVWFMAR
jgi:hypothetical protein